MYEEKYKIYIQRNVLCARQQTECSCILTEGVPYSHKRYFTSFTTEFLPDFYSTWRSSCIYCLYINCVYEFYINESDAHTLGIFIICAYIGTGCINIVTVLHEVEGLTIYKSTSLQILAQFKFANDNFTRCEKTPLPVKIILR